jgi:hypothetical protein
MPVQQIDDRIEELRTLREWLTTSDDVETAEDVSELLTGLGYSQEAQDLMDIAKGRTFGNQPNAYRLKEMHRIIDSVVRNGDVRRVTARPRPQPKAVRQAPAEEARALRIEWIGYLIFFLLGFLAARYFG